MASLFVQTASFQQVVIVGLSCLLLCTLCNFALVKDVITLYYLSTERWPIFVFGVKLLKDIWNGIALVNGCDQQFDMGASPRGWWLYRS